MINVNLSTPALPTPVAERGSDPASFTAATQDGTALAATVEQQADMQDLMLAQQKKTANDQAGQGLLQIKIGDEGGISVGGAAGGGGSLGPVRATAPAVSPVASAPTLADPGIGDILASITETTQAATQTSLQVAQNNSGAAKASQLAVGDANASGPVAGGSPGAGVGDAIQTLSAVAQSGAAGAATPTVAATAMVAEVAVQAVRKGDMKLAGALLKLLDSLKQSMENYGRFNTASADLDLLEINGLKLGTVQTRVLHTPKPRMPTPLDLSRDADPAIRPRADLSLVRGLIGPHDEG